MDYAITWPRAKLIDGDGLPAIGAVLALLLLLFCDVAILYQGVHSPPASYSCRRP